MKIAVLLVCCSWVVAQSTSGTPDSMNSVPIAAMPTVRDVMAYVPEAAPGLSVAMADPGRQTVIVRAELAQRLSLYAAIWEQRQGPAWQARHGLTAGQYQQTFDQLNAQGYRLVDVSGYSSGGEDRYAAIWEQSAGPAWQARHGLTAGQYQQTFDQLNAQGYRLVRVSGYGSGGQQRYAAIWEQRQGPAWQARHGLTAGQYQQTFDQLNAQGYRLVDVSGYNPQG